MRRRVRKVEAFQAALRAPARLAAIARVASQKKGPACAGPSMQRVAKRLLLDFFGSSVGRRDFFDGRSSGVGRNGGRVDRFSGGGVGAFDGDVGSNGGVGSGGVGHSGFFGGRSGVNGGGVRGGFLVAGRQGEDGGGEQDVELGVHGNLRKRQTMGTNGKHNAGFRDDC